MPNKEDVQILYQTHAGPQSAFMTSDAEELLYGGAVGGGKSYALRAWAVRYCMTYPEARVVLFRQTYRQLDETHIIEIKKEVPKAVAHYSASTHDLVFNHTNAILHLRYCEHDEDARSYDTAEFDAILFDELTHFSQFIYTYLTSRCRSTKDWWPGPRIRSGATPLGVGHDWVKSRWIAKPAGGPGEVWQGPVSEGGMTRQFIPARVTDNPTLAKADPQYMERLRALSRDEYRAKALGDWDVFSGQFFTRWDPVIHVIEPMDIPPDWDKYLCVDYGFNAPYAALWFARPPETRSAYFYREQYGKGITGREQVYRAHQVTLDAGETIRAVVLDPSMFSKVNVKGERVAALADDWKQAFAGTSNVIRGNNERISGWRLMREMIEWQERPDGGVLLPPRLFVFNTCTNLVRTIPNLICHETNVEDVDSDSEDHAPDAARYGLVHAFAGTGSRKPVSYSIGPSGIVRK